MYKLINKEQKIICSADEIHLLSDSAGDGIKVDGFSNELKQNYYSVEINGKRGVVSQTGRIIVPCKYDWVKMKLDHFCGTISDPNNNHVNIGGYRHYIEDLYNYEGRLIYSRSYTEVEGSM